MIDFHNPEAFFSTLKKLSPKDQPQFGLMTPQHMVEHLILLVKISNGKIPQLLIFSVEKAEKWKQRLLYTDMEFPKDIKAPGLPQDSLLELHFENLTEAIEKLENEIIDFFSYFQNNSGVHTTHPILGELNELEWTLFHSKHFTHHFKQFGLI